VGAQRARLRDRRRYCIAVTQENEPWTSVFRRPP
jgi:hypothetical protein